MKLSEKDQIAYLANVIFVANADGKPSAKAIAALEEIRLAIGAKKSTFDVATKVARTSNFTLVKLDSFAAEACNVADIIYVCVIDGGFSEQEKSMIAQLSKISSLTDKQFIQLTRDSIERTKRDEISIACPACKAEVGGDSVFCPKCGASLTSASLPNTDEFEIPQHGYAIEFCESTSADFPFALRIAEAAPHFESTSRNKKNWYLAAWPSDEFEKTVKLAELLGSLRNRKCYLDGAEIAWDELFGFVWCAGAMRGSW